MKVIDSKVVVRAEVIATVVAVGNVNVVANSTSC